MRGIIHDLSQNTFIEGPIETKPITDQFQQASDDNTINSYTQTKEVPSRREVEDVDIPYYEVNEQY